MRRGALIVLAVALSGLSCGKPAGTSVGPSVAASGSETPAAVPSLHGTPCGALDCRQYAAPVDAFLDAVGPDPLVVGVGEAHAPKGASVPSSAKRFADALLPALAGRASDLLVELMMPPAGCVEAAAQVRQEQKAVTSRESEKNQDDYVAMGEKARSMGVVPDMLRPTCADMDAVRDAGDSAIAASLDLIARLTRSQATRLVDRDARSDADRGKMVLVYGGMLHNDLAPPPEAAEWSYAPAIDTHVRGRFVAVDLVVPEFIGDDDTWRSLPWWQHYDKAKMGAKATLFRTGERSYVVVFPVSASGKELPGP
jgi:hypothetical protein